jgi:2-iminobutanoate/2-iminopropanoate deaminase
MSSNRVRVAAAAGLIGLIAGIVVTVAAQTTGPAARSAPGRRVIRPAGVPNIGLPLSPGILVGDTLYLAGTTGRDPATTKLVAGGIEAETRQALANIEEVLKAAGMSLTDVATVTVFIANFDDFARFNAVYTKYFPKDPPARATVQVVRLNDGARIELQMIAVRR